MWFRIRDMRYDGDSSVSPPSIGCFEISKMDRYKIPKERCRVETRMNNSRFITTIAPVFSVTEAHAFLQEIRKEMPDATHHVYAFRVGFGNSVSEGMSDDGEPSGTSGPPTLAVVRGSGLGDVAVVTTRYFGGTKLGTGGLVSAYTAAAQAAFAAVEVDEKVEKTRCAIQLPYSYLDRVRRMLGEFEASIEDERYEVDVNLQLVLPKENFARLAERLSDETAGNVVPKEIE